MITGNSSLLNYYVKPFDLLMVDDLKVTSIDSTIFNKVSKGKERERGGYI